jgi:hypothetical protein
MNEEIVYREIISWSNRRQKECRTVFRVKGQYLNRVKHK